MFSQFPKIRTPLSPEIQRIYAEQYKSNRQGKTQAASLAQKMERWLHVQVAKTAGAGDTLELGAGTLNQLPYEPQAQAYDIVEPFQKLFEDSPHLNRMRKVYADLKEIPLEIRYDRITSVAVLEHICNLPEVIAKSGLHLKERGVFCASIPNEGTWLWTLGWKCTTGLEFRLKHGLDYGQLMKHEHVNTAEEMEEVLRYFFQDVRCKVFGVSKGIAFYRYYECRNADPKRCAEFAGV